jgi:hypothetical protein
MQPHAELPLTTPSKPLVMELIQILVATTLSETHGLLHGVKVVTSTLVLLMHQAFAVSINQLCSNKPLLEH